MKTVLALASGVAATFAAFSARADSVRQQIFEPTVSVRVDFGGAGHVGQMARLAAALEIRGPLIADKRATPMSELTSNNLLAAQGMPLLTAFELSASRKGLTSISALGRPLMASSARLDSNGDGDSSSGGGGSWMWWAIGGVAATVAAVALSGSDGSDGDRDPGDGPPECGSINANVGPVESPSVDSPTCSP